MNLDLGRVRSSATLSYFANLIQALQHPVNASYTYNSGMAVREIAQLSASVCKCACVGVRVRPGRVHVLYMCVMKTKWRGVWVHGFSPPSLIRQPPGVWCECRPGAYSSELLHKSVLPREKPGYMWTPLTSRLIRTPFFLSFLFLFRCF